MERPKATHQRPQAGRIRKRGACIRVGVGGMAAGDACDTKAFWLTPDEAGELLVELESAVRRARAVGMPEKCPPRARRNRRPAA